MHDNVNHPSHYTAGKVECIDAIEAAVEGLAGEEAVLTGQVIKYIWRWKKKNGLEDLKKAGWYLSRLTKKIEAKAEYAQDCCLRDWQESMYAHVMSPSDSTNSTAAQVEERTTLTAVSMEKMGVPVGRLEFPNG